MELYGALKKSVNNMLSTFVAAITNVIANFVCILFFGVYGAVIGTAISYIVLGIYRMVDVNRFMHIKYNIPKFIINSTVFGIATLFSTLNFHIYLILFCDLRKGVNYFQQEFLHSQSVDIGNTVISA